MCYARKPNQYNTAKSVFKHFTYQYDILTSQLAARSDLWICGDWPAGNAGSNPAEGMDVRVLCLLCVV
jgi:hypothetical protein